MKKIMLMVAFLGGLFFFTLPIEGDWAEATDPAGVINTLSFPLTDTGQTHFYDNSKEMAQPQAGAAFSGQDAAYRGATMQYRDNQDGTVTDLVTGLMWQQNPGAKKTWTQAIAGAKACNLGGYTDWRMPTIKELYSLINFSGITGTTVASSKPFIDTTYFDFAYGDSAKGERIIDCQYWSGTKYVSTTMNGDSTIFGVNFADGRIKGYPEIKKTPGKTSPSTMYTMFVRGNSAYGKNNFVDNQDGTITDKATGLMWMQKDSGLLKAGKNKDGKLNWAEALAWSEGLSYAGFDDWRLPNAKELQSIVDYNRSLDTTKSAAINPMFLTSSILDPAGKLNYPYFWSSTTHLDGANRYAAAVYVAFGEAQGYMQLPPNQGKSSLFDVHGAGAQRSDPKAGDPTQYSKGRGPQGDVVTIYNFVRCVRTVN